MKKIILATLAISLVVSVKAQIKIGVRVAPQMTWSTSDNKSTTTNGTRINVAYGMMLDYFFTENYALGTEFGIQSFGTNLNLDKSRYSSITYTDRENNNAVTTIANLEDLTYDYQLRYITVPIMLKMRTNEIGNLRYYAEFGYASGFLIRSKADVSMDRFELTNVNINEPDDEDKFDINTQKYSDKVSSYRGSLVFGAGVQYNIFGNSMLIAGLRYDNGFTSFTSDDRWSTSLSNVALNIGMLF
ncbi:MAG: porin family protein [Bacteroidota bacterium]